MTLAELPQYHSLSIHEKLELVDEIWKTVLPDADASDVTDEEKQLLDSRWSQFLSAPESALSLEEFKMKLQRLRS